MADKKKELSSAERKSLEKQRKNAVKQAQKFRREQARKKLKESKSESTDIGVSEVQSKSKIEQALKSQIKEDKESRPRKKETREEKFRREGKKRIANLEAKDYDDGYYIDEYGEKQKQERRAKEIHEQEQEVIRRPNKPLTSKQIKRKRIFVYAGIIAAVVVLGVVLSLTVLFKTEKIIVEGNEYYYEDQIIAFSGVEKQENIFIAALTSTPDKIKENLPYVEKAEISFSIPDTVKIKITNAEPSYAIPNGGGFLLVSGKGRILASVPNNDSGLAILTCSELKDTNPGKYVAFSDDNVPEILDNISAAITKNKFEGITGIDVTNTAQLKLVYQNRITIVLGMPDELDYKLQTAKAIIDEKLDPNNTGAIAGTLDVSECNTTKVSRFKPSETTAPVATEPSSTASWDENTWTNKDDGANTDNGDYGDYTWEPDTNGGTSDDWSADDWSTDDGSGDSWSGDGTGNDWSGDGTGDYSGDTDWGAGGDDSYTDYSGDETAW